MRHIILSTGELLGHDWSASRVFSSSWFGDASVNATGRVLTGGRWAYTPIRTDVDAPERNGYGRVTDRMNADPAKVLRRDVCGAPGPFRRATTTTSEQLSRTPPVKYLTRGASEVCGLATRSTLPGCDALRVALRSTNLEDLDRTVEYHTVGAFDSYS